MRFVRYILDNSPRYGWVNEDAIGPMEGIPYGDYRRLETNKPLNEVKLLPPVEPSKIIGVHNNYQTNVHNDEDGYSDVPSLFMKPPSSLLGHKGTIIIPPQATNIQVSAHLAVVVGKEARWVQVEDTKNYILGYMICNDIAAIDLVRRDQSWLRSKGFDTFCPAGPWIQTNFNDLDAQIRCYVNGELRQVASTHEMVFTIGQVISYITSIMTLKPGDIILTGTPGGSSQVVSDDFVEISIEGIGTLVNYVTTNRKLA